MSSIHTRLGSHFPIVCQKGEEIVMEKDDDDNASRPDPRERSSEERVG